jgi:uncharacterized protein YyaL (SSP411 family)
MAHWETEIQIKSGAVQGGPVCPPEEQTPAVFNTGAVLLGWSAAYRATFNLAFLDASQRAAEFLLADLGSDGHFRTHGPFVLAEPIKTYNVLCAWALYRLGEDTSLNRYKDAALKVTHAALQQQHRNGWFANNCLTDSRAPLLHTSGYTLQGILEVGYLAGCDDFLISVQRGTDPVIERIGKTGFLHGRYYSDWEPASFSSCLTGSAQIAVVCYRLYQITGVSKYRLAGDRILNYLKALQLLDSPDPGIYGALAGSFPLFGNYMSFGYPSWATKYLLDALMLQDEIRKNTSSQHGSLKRFDAENEVHVAT